MYTTIEYFVYETKKTPTSCTNTQKFSQIYVVAMDFVDF
jgi:hypothetical protein